MSLATPRHWRVKLGPQLWHTLLLEKGRLAIASGAATSCNLEPTEHTQNMQSVTVKLDDSWRADQQSIVAAVDSFVKAQQVHEGNKAILSATTGCAGKQPANKVGATPKEGEVNSRVIADATREAAEQTAHEQHIVDHMSERIIGAAAGPTPAPAARSRRRSRSSSRSSSMSSSALGLC